PLVVVVPPEIQPDRLVLALAAYADHPAGDGAARCTEGTARRRRECGLRRRARRSPAPRLSGLLRSRLDPRLTERAGRDRIEVVVRDGVLELFPNEVSLHERVEAGRQRLRAHVVQPDRADVLLSAEHELF